MADRRGRACFALKPSDSFSFLQVFITKYVRANRFDSYLAGDEVLVSCQLDLAHGAASQSFLQKVTAGQQPGPGQRVFGVCLVLWADSCVVFVTAFTTWAFAHGRIDKRLTLRPGFASRE